MRREGQGPSAIVVGAGVFGASIAHALVSRGWEVQIVEQHSPAHVRASSHDSSRLLRMGHGDEDLPDHWYARSALNSRSHWLQIAEEEGVELFLPCGGVWLARSAEGFESRSARDLSALGIAAEVLAPEEAAQFFPAVRCDDLAFVLYEPLAGVLRATTCVRTLISRAVRQGAEVRTARARPSGAGVQLDNGEQLLADRVIWACGPWLPSIFAGRLDLRSVKQSVFYFGADPRWTTPPVPAWIDDSGDGYGLGDLDGHGVKAVHVRPGGGQGFDPDHGERLPEPGALARTRDLLGHRFPSLAAAPLVATRVCQYELTADHHFVIAPTDETAREWIVGGGSGHGFKHGPVLGEYVADLLEGRHKPRAAFALDRGPVDEAATS